MPIEIDEIVISVEVGPAPSGKPGSEGAPAALPLEQRQALIEECVERVLLVLRDRHEP